MADVCAMRFENCDEESQDSRDSQRQGAPDGDKSAEAGRDEDEPPPPPVPLARPPFECHSPCPLLPSRYVERIMKYTQCSPCTLVVAIVYLQRLKDREASGPSAAGAGCQPLRLTSFNIQRMFLTAMMIAHKFLDEPVCSNKQWSLVGDLTVKEMNSLELHMLWTLQFDCNVSRAEYDACQAALGALDASLPEHRAPALALQPRAPCTASSIAISA